MFGSESGLSEAARKLRPLRWIQRDGQRAAARIDLQGPKVKRPVIADNQHLRASSGDSRLLLRPFPVDRTTTVVIHEFHKCVPYVAKRNTCSVYTIPPNGACLSARRGNAFFPDKTTICFSCEI